MMSKSRTNKFAILKIITAIPLAAVLIILFSFSISNTTIAQEKVKTVKKSDQKVIKTKEVETFVVVEQMPNYPGGEKAMFKFIGENIKYPEEARKQGISGRVYVTFVVEDDGEITDIKLLRGIGGGCDEEAVRVISIMPSWKPGLQRGKPVRTQFNLPIKFKLNGGKKIGLIKKETKSDIPPPPRSSAKSGSGKIPPPDKK